MPHLLCAAERVVSRLTPHASTGLRTVPVDLSYDACLEESKTVMFDVAEKAMAAAGVTPCEVQRPTHVACLQCCNNPHTVALLMQTQRQCWFKAKGCPV